MRRITFKGAELEGFEPTLPASYLKLIFPEPGQIEPARPLPDGYAYLHTAGSSPSNAGS